MHPGGRVCVIDIYLNLEQLKAETMRLRVCLRV